MDEYKYFAKIYDPLLHLAIHRVRAKVTDIIDRYNPAKIIDLCCGTGNQLKYLKKKGFTNAVGVDLSQSMLYQAEKGKEKVRCENQNAAQLSFSENTFDIGIISFALHEKPVETAKKIVKEAARVTKPGGHLVVVDYCRINKTPLHIKAAIHFAERFAGKDHYMHFRNYLNLGGLDELLKDYKLKESYTFHRGGTCVRVYKIEKYEHYA